MNKLSNDIIAGLNH